MKDKNGISIVIPATPRSPSRDRLIQLFSETLLDQERLMKEHYLQKINQLFLKVDPDLSETELIICRNLLRPDDAVRGMSLQTELMQMFYPELPSTIKDIIQTVKLTLGGEA